MVYDSLKSLLDEYPYFLDKNKDSNFTKTRIVWNNRLKDLHNDIFLVYLAGKITKHILIWKEQNVEYDYTMYFAVSLPNLKRVTCYKNDEVIYSKEYLYEDNADKFLYTHNDTTNIEEETITINDDDEDIEPIHYDPPIIPEDKYHIEVETYAEYHITKGFPENDTRKGDMYDHDYSLDEIGKFYNLPRKTYHTYFDKKVLVPKDDKTTETIEKIIREPVDYRYTEPPYNNCLTEDDFHYMNRILYYSEHIHDTPLPVLELWKLFGDNINTTMINREVLLCKMYDPKKHLKSDGSIDEDWIPHRWEHKDMMCEPEKEEIFFFASVNNSQPLMGRKIKFTFRFFNSLIEPNYDYLYVKPYFIDNETGELVDMDVVLDYHENPENIKEWMVKVNDFYDLYGLPDDVYDIRLIFRAFLNSDDVADESNYIESDELNILIKGCNNADWYVDAVNGDDNNTGDNENPFQTLAKAVNKVEAEHNVIVLKRGEHYIDSTMNISKNMSIICCSESTVFNNTNCSHFSIKNDTYLDIQNVKLKYNCCEMFATDEEFVNNNKKNIPQVVEIPLTACKIPVNIDAENRTPHIYAHTNYTILGHMLTKELIGRRTYIKETVISEHETMFDFERKEIKHLNEPDLPVSDADIKLYLNETFVAETITDSEGDYSFDLKFRSSGEYNYLLKYEESDTYCGSDSNVLFTVDNMPTILNARLTTDKIYVDTELPLIFNVKDYYGNNVEEGEFNLYDGDNLVATIDYDETDFHYAPDVGLHNFKLTFTGEGYVTSVVEDLIIDVVKHDTSIDLLTDKAYYIVGEETLFNGVLYDENHNTVADANVSLYVDDEYISWKTTGEDGDVTFNRVLTEGVHDCYLKYNGDTYYNSCTSNVFRVKVRSEEIPDINLHLYPKYKILGDATSVECSVYACDSTDSPLETSFRIWNSYDIIKDTSKDCEMNMPASATTYTTDSTGWVTFTLQLPMLSVCNGVLIQAISTLDSEVYSEIVWIRQYIDRPLTITGDLTPQSTYSYRDESITFTGYLVDEEENRVPNEYVHIELYNGNTKLNELDVLTNIKGEFNYNILNQGVRLNDLTLKARHTANTKYGLYNDEDIIEFYPPETEITDIGTFTTYLDEDTFNLPVTVIDEFNNPCVDGDVTLTVDGETYTSTIVNGAGTFTNIETPALGEYTCTIEYEGNGYYEDSSLTFTLIVAKADTGLTLNIPSEVTFSDEFHINGVLNNITKGTVVAGESVDLYVNNVKVSSSTTNNRGEYNLTHTILDSSTPHTIQVKYAGSINYNACNSNECTINVNKEISILHMEDIPNILFKSTSSTEDLVVEGLLLTDDDEPISEDIIIRLVKDNSTVIVETTVTADNTGAFKYIESDLDLGNYSLLVKHNESDNYTQTLFETTFKVIDDVGDIELYLDVENADGDVHVGEVFLITVINEYFGEKTVGTDYFESAELKIYDSNNNLVNVPHEINIWNDALIYTILYGATTSLNAGDYRVKVTIPRTTEHMEHTKEITVTIKP